MKKVLILMFVVCMVLGLVACAKPLEEKIAEEIAEDMVENMVEEMGDVDAGDVDVDVDSDGDATITINDGEDQVVIEGSESGMPWPTDKLPANVPELKGVKVVSVASTNEGILIGFEECDNDEATEYIKQIKGAGWTSAMDMSGEDGGMIMASNDAAESLMFVWDTEDQSGALTYSSAQ